MTTATELVALTGSEKQVEWANKIRSEFLVSMDREAKRYLGSIRGKKLTEEEGGKFLNRVEGYKAKWCKNTEASWWIAKRYYQADDLVKLVS